MRVIVRNISFYIFQQYLSGRRFSMIIDLEIVPVKGMNFILQQEKIIPPPPGSHVKVLQVEYFVRLSTLSTDKSRYIINFSESF